MLRLVLLLLQNRECLFSMFKSVTVPSHGQHHMSRVSLLPLPILSSVYGIVFVTNNRLQLTSWRPEEAILNVSIAWSDSPHYWHTLHWYAQCTYAPISTDNQLAPPMNNSVLTMDGKQRRIGNCLCKQIVTLPTSHHHRHRQNTALPSITTRNLVVISIYWRKGHYCCKDVR